MHDIGFPKESDPSPAHGCGSWGKHPGYLVSGVAGRINCSSKIFTTLPSRKQEHTIPWFFSSAGLAHRPHSKDHISLRPKRWRGPALTLVQQTVFSPIQEQRAGVTRGTVCLSRLLALPRAQYFMLSCLLILFFLRRVRKG